MAKKNNHRTVVFLEDFAAFKAGGEFSCDGMLARSLVDRGVAEFKDAAPEVVKEKVEMPEKKEKVSDLSFSNTEKVEFEKDFPVRKKKKGSK